MTLLGIHVSLISRGALQAPLPFTPFAWGGAWLSQENIAFSLTGVGLQVTARSTVLPSLLRTVKVPTSTEPISGLGSRQALHDQAANTSGRQEILQGHAQL